MQRILATAVLATLATLGPQAHAFGNRGDVSFAADRLMGVYLVNQDPGNDTDVGLGIAAPGGHPYTTPRLGIDGFVTNGLSIGASMGLWSRADRPGGRSNSGILIAPRVGYAIQFSRSFGFWPRGGITYRGHDNYDEVALTLEGMFYGAPADHFAFIFGPAFDLGMVGDGGARAVNLGLLTAGILGWI